MTTQVEKQNHDAPRADQANAESGSEDEAVALFNQRAQSQAQNEPETPEDEPQDDPAPEPEEGEPENEVEAAEKLVEVEYEGETHKLPPKLKDALLRQADYSRNMQALGESKKDYAQRIESATKLMEGAEKRAEVIAEAKQLDAQIKQFDGVDFDGLEREDPARASLLALKLMRLQQARASIDGRLHTIDVELATERNKTENAARAEMVKVLSKEFPGGWNDGVAKRLGDYVIAQGLSSDDLNVTNAKTVLLWEKARKFDAIEAGKAKALAQTREAPPVARPGAPRRAAPAVDAQARFQKSTSPEDAVAVFEARAMAKRR